MPGASAAKPEMALAASSDPTPTTFTLPSLSLAMRWTWSIWLRQTGHHGAQNQNSAGLPVRLAPLNSPPSTLVPVNCRVAGTFFGLRPTRYRRSAGQRARSPGRLLPTGLSKPSRTLVTP